MWISGKVADNEREDPRETSYFAMISQRPLLTISLPAAPPSQIQPSSLTES